jgi:hypothetical protein
MNTQVTSGNNGEMKYQTVQGFLSASDECTHARPMREVAFCAGFRPPVSQNFNALRRPAAEKRQGTKSRREMVRQQCRALWGFSGVARMLKGYAGRSRRGID